MTAQEKFDELVRDGVWPFLRAHGFKRTRATFHRPVGDNWEVINFQKSSWSDRRSVKFTVNLGWVSTDCAESCMTGQTAAARFSRAASSASGSASS